MKHTPLFLAAASIIAAGLVVAGPLTPPPGPLASSYKTLSEVEPRTAVNAVNTPGTASAIYQITQPGSYYLTGPVTGAPGKSGIVIASSGVTLDLNGFDVLGVEGSADGVRIGSPLAPLRNITVRNGSIRGWGALGLDGAAPSASNCVYTDLTSQGNTNAGFFLGEGSVVSACAATENGGPGFFAVEACTLSRCSARGNSQAGFMLSTGCIAAECTAMNNTTSGFIGVSGGLTLSACSSLYNYQKGFYVAVTYPNPGATTCTACTASGNGAEGFYSSDGTLFSACNAGGNALDGFSLGSNCTIRGCTAEYNSGAGASGIALRSTGNRAEDNHLIGNRYGLSALQPGNFIARNTARDNITAPFSIAAGNSAAPVISSPGANAFATMTAWSNVAY